MYKSIFLHYQPIKLLRNVKLATPIARLCSSPPTNDLQTLFCSLLWSLSLRTLQKLLKNKYSSDKLTLYFRPALSFRAWLRSWCRNYVWTSDTPFARIAPPLYSCAENKEGVAVFGSRFSFVTQLFVALFLQHRTTALPHWRHLLKTSVALSALSDTGSSPLYLLLHI